MKKMQTMQLTLGVKTYTLHSTDGMDWRVDGLDNYLRQYPDTRRWVA